MVGRIASSHWFRPSFSQARNYRTGRSFESKSPRNEVCVSLTTNLRWADAPGNLALVMVFSKRPQFSGVSQKRHRLVRQAVQPSVHPRSSVRLPRHHLDG